MANDSLQNELGRLREDLLKMGRLLQQQVYDAVKALADKNIELARQVIENDDLIDDMELDIEKRSLGLIALKQPLARDLRLIASIFRIIIDIERMADHAEDIAHIAQDLHEQAYIKPLIDIPRMAVITQDMLETALRAFIEEDCDLAMSLVLPEKELDGLYEQVFNELLFYMVRDPRNIPQATALLLVAGHLERIGDHATNIGEMVVYVVDGKRIDLNRISRG
ncbi:MAG: phosphate signaling complex protein PhoU [Syntrophomonadaceae bacterium]|jgi:phosphate transport system protein|uniref:Phosphate-specific transport system accessory protein PhoU n=1 Tax=Syntrophomonas wolfei TaxID=863 RepID=A0A354YWG9_9FIRM|nr:phosphate signaling complex protein PhoU [Syntrophomonadaceae bacterium]HBK53544.1 phosphate transport system regulatory protein PhoU [Syntrophomonas wolfei]